MHFVFYNGHYFGYCDNKKVVKQFLKERNDDNFQFMTIDPDEYDDLSLDEGTELYYFEEFGGVYIEDEVSDAISEARDRLAMLNNYASFLHRDLAFLKLTDMEEKTLKTFVHYVEELMNKSIQQEDDGEELTHYFMNLTSILNYMVS